ncbi:MAG: SRPBCC family protein [Maribacter sp.]|nr:SRPBCC family protein [Maribacter sp.]
MEAIKMIRVTAMVDAPLTKVWTYWTEPQHIIKWNNASPDWHTPTAENDLRNDGRFNYRMEARDGSYGFDFWGIYDTVEPNKAIAYTMGDGRKVAIDFKETKKQVQITETFEPENENPIEMQKGGWQAILDNFKKYVEEN